MGRTVVIPRNRISVCWHVQQADLVNNSERPVTICSFVWDETIMLNKQSNSYINTNTNTHARTNTHKHTSSHNQTQTLKNSYTYVHTVNV